MKNVNSKDLLRYLPDDLLTDEQRKIKHQGIVETIKYTNEKNDKAYKDYLSKGDLKSAQKMVEEVARRALSQTFQNM